MISRGLGRDLSDPRWMYLKAAGFVLIAACCICLILVEHKSLKTALLLATACWATARAYYFLFYVIEHYIDPAFRYEGWWSAIRYILFHRVVENKMDRSQVKIARIERKSLSNRSLSNQPSDSGKEPNDESDQSQNI